MLFESEAKAINFINFNADDIAAENKGVPVRAYYCMACGGWHITKHDNGDWFKAKEVSQNVILSYQAELKIIITDFFTNYSNKQPFELWKLKMDKALELYGKLQDMDVHNEVMVKAGRCFKQFQVNLARKKKKAMAEAAEVYLAPVRELVANLEKDILGLNLDSARKGAGLILDKLDEMESLGMVPVVAGQYRTIAQTVLDNQYSAVMEGMVNAVMDAQHKVLADGGVMTDDELEDLEDRFNAFEKVPFKKAVIRQFGSYIQAVKDGSVNNGRKQQQAAQRKDAHCIRQIRALLGEVIAAMEVGDRQAAEDKLEVADIFLERMSHTKSWFELSAMADKLKKMLS